MANSEKGLWTYFNPKMKAAQGANWHAERIESHASVAGQPDVNYCLFGIEGNLELKHSRRSGKDFELRPSEHQWMRRRLKAGGICWILAEIAETKEWLMIYGDKSESLIRNPSQANWRKQAYVVMDSQNVESNIKLISILLRTKGCKP